MKLHRPVSVLVAGFLLLSGSIHAGDEFADRFEQARRLTWKQESREQGIDGLKRLVAERPAAFEPRLELARALTWSPATRADGVAALERLLAERPQATEVIEPLAEV